MAIYPNRRQRRQLTTHDTETGCSSAGPAAREKLGRHSVRSLQRPRREQVTDMTTISIRVSAPARLTSAAAHVPTSAVSIWKRFARFLQNTWCVINGGHYKVLHTEPDRMALRCVACGHTSPGWVVGSSRLARTMPADPERLRAVRRRMVA